MRKTILAATIMLLAGCAAQQTYWVHTHNNQQRAAQDQLDCEQQALRMYPRLIVNQQITPPTQTPSTITCNAIGSNITCNEFGGRRDPGLSIPMDANNRLRGEAIATCLCTKGYQLMSNEQIDRANAANRPTPQPIPTSRVVLKEPDQHINPQTYEQSEQVSVQNVRGGVRLVLGSVSSSMTRREWKVCHYESSRLEASQVKHQIEIMSDKQCLPSVITK